MKGEYTPDCSCDPPRPVPEFWNIQTEELPIRLGLIVRCQRCKKPWKETLCEYWKPANEEAVE